MCRRKRNSIGCSDRELRRDYTEIDYTIQDGLKNSEWEEKVGQNSERLKFRSDGRARKLRSSIKVR